MLEAIAKAFYRARGYEVVFRKYKLFKGELPHSIVMPRATYSPWSSDESFLNTFNKVKTFTLVDIYRCFELWQLVQELTTVEGDILEVGVWKGGTAGIMATAAAENDPKATVYLCDTFEGVVKAGEKDNKYVGGEHKDTSDNLVKGLLGDTLSLSNFETLKGIFPDDTGHLISDRKIKLCHIDVDVYESAKASTDWVWERMPVGGVIVYDDFGFSGTQGVTAYLEGERGTPGRLVLHNLNGHGLMIKVR